MASASASASPSTSYEIGNNYSPFDVFINHRGPDVKKGLASHLYHSLRRQGLRVFLDIEELQAGDNLKPQIVGAINTASLHIAIFSPRYAESHWCLNELVQMLDTGKTIIPVFYKVNPSELRRVRSGNGVYAQDLSILAKKREFDSQPRHDSHTIEKWTNALSVVAEISGFDLNACDGDEGLLVQKVVEQVFKKVGKTPLHVAKYPTGLNDKVEDFESTVLSQHQSEQSTAVGIVGLGGVGKSTLAKELFNRYRSKYDQSCFLSDVRENAARGLLKGLQSTLLKDLGQPDVHISSTHEGIETLKRRLSYSPRVLVVIDDVDHMSQLDALFLPIKHAIRSSCFILVTSRDTDLLKKSGIVESFIYKQRGLNQHHSQELFCLHAFNNPYPRAGFEQMVEQFLDVCGGLPLSLQVIGALLRHEDLHYWKAQFNKISKIPPTDILSRLKVSYDSLDDEEKQIFLDAACFFIGEERDTAIRIWEGSRWQGWLGLRNLENKCLLEVDSENRIRMHDHLRDLGRNIAKTEIPHRLWRSDDIVFDNSPVRGISMVDGTDPAESLEIPTNIRGLQLLRAQGNSVERIFNVPQPPHPVWLRWDSCPYSSLPSWISLKNLRVLHIKGGEMETLWQNQSQVPLQLRELNIDADLFNVPKSIGTLKHLEKFVLRRPRGNWDDSVGLRNLPFEVCDLHSLKLLKLEKCKDIRFLPPGHWTELREINLSYCSALLKLPDSAGIWKNIQRIYLRGCYALRELPDSAGNWTNLQYIECSHIKRLPDSAGNWTNLREINLSECSGLQGLPDSAGNWTNLEVIDLSYCYAMQGLPDSAGNWTNLREINLSYCYLLQELPDSVGNWTNLREVNMGLCSAVEGLPDSAGNWTNLRQINLSNCVRLQELPDSAGNWTNLRQMYLSACDALQGLPDSAGNWINLEDIDLSQCFRVQGLPDSAGNWTKLRNIDLRKCVTLQALPDSTGNWMNLERMDLTNCSNLRWTGDVVELLRQRLQERLLR